MRIFFKELNQHLPILEPNISTKPPENSFRITWLGHASVLAEFDNITVLTDPMFSERASPSQVIGPKRYRDPPCTVIFYFHSIIFDSLFDLLFIYRFMIFLRIWMPLSYHIHIMIILI